MNSRRSSLKELMLVRIREFIREPEAIFWVYVFPILLMVGLGVAFQDRTETYRVAVAVAPGVDGSWAYTSLERQETLDVTQIATSRTREADTRNPWDLVVIVEENGLRYLRDPSNPGGHSAQLTVEKLLQEARGRQDPVPTVTEEISRPGGRYIDWLVPGLMGLNIMGGGLWGVGFVTVDLRIRKLLKRLYATPMRRADLLLAIVGSRIVFLVPEMAVILTVAHVVFGLTVAGNALSLAVVIIIGALSFAGLGLLVASRARRIETISGLLNAVMVPMWLLSGVFFSAERFPDAMQPFVKALPLTQLNNALRAVILDGEGPASFWPGLVVLGLWGGLSFPLALKWFRWQ